MAYCVKGKRMINNKCIVYWPKTRNTLKDHIECLRLYDHRAAWDYDKLTKEFAESPEAVGRCIDRLMDHTR